MPDICQPVQHPRPNLLSSEPRTVGQIVVIRQVENMGPIIGQNTVVLCPLSGSVEASPSLSFTAAVPNAFEKV